MLSQPSWAESQLCIKATARHERRTRVTVIEVQTWHLRSVKGIISFPMEAILYRLHSPADDDSMIKRLNSNDADEAVETTIKAQIFACRNTHRFKVLVTPFLRHISSGNACSIDDFTEGRRKYWMLWKGII